MFTGVIDSDSSSPIIFVKLFYKYLSIIVVDIYFKETFAMLSVLPEYFWVYYKVFRYIPIHLRPKVRSFLSTAFINYIFVKKYSYKVSSAFSFHENKECRRRYDIKFQK